MNIEELVLYLENSLPEIRKQEIDKILLEQPYYFNVLKGLQVLKERFEDKESLLSFLSMEGGKLKNSLSNHSNQMTQPYFSEKKYGE